MKNMLRWFLLSLAVLICFDGISHGQILRVSQFPGVDVGRKETAAIASCQNVNIPCILVFDPELAIYPQGTAPALCAQCYVIDYRNGNPVPTNLTKVGPMDGTPCTGIVGDGVTDDSTALNACLAAKPHVWLPKTQPVGSCDYYINASLIMHGVEQLIQGSGGGHNNGTTICVEHGVTGIKATNTAAGAPQILELNLREVNGAPGTGDGIQMSAAHWFIENVYISGFRHGFNCDSSLSASGNCDNGTGIRIWSRQNVSDAFRFSGVDANQNTCTMCSGTESAIGFDVGGFSNVFISPDTYGNTTTPIKSTGNAGANIFFGVYAEGSQPAAQIDFRNIYVVAADFPSVDFTGAPTVIQASGVGGFTFYGTWTTQHASGAGATLDNSLVTFGSGCGGSVDMETVFGLRWGAGCTKAMDWRRAGGSSGEGWGPRTGLTTDSSFKLNYPYIAEDDAASTCGTHTPCTKFHNGIKHGANTASDTENYWIHSTTGSAPAGANPAGGNWQPGDMETSVAPTTGGKCFGFVNTAGGSPGTWKCIPYLPGSATNTVTQFVGTITTTASTSDALTVTGIGTGSHCSAIATNATGSTITGVYLAQTANTVTLNHSNLANGTFDVFCTF